MQQSFCVFLTLVVCLNLVHDVSSFVFYPSTIRLSALNRNHLVKASTSSSSSVGDNSPRVNEGKKKVSDRTQEEAASLIQDIIQALVDAGPQAGPVRTFQAVSAFRETFREFLPQIGKPTPVFFYPEGYTNTV